MEFNTKYFGAIRCDEESILQFPQGLFGFEDEKEFLLLPFEGSDESLLCFQSVTTPQLAFVAMNPFFLSRSYAPILKPDELESLDVAQSEDLCYYTLCVVKEPVSKSTVNFKCPVVINDITRKARQVILDQYEMRHLLSDFSKEEEEEA